MPGLFGFPSPLRDAILGYGASPPAVTPPAPMLQGSPEWYTTLNDAREQAFPRGKAPAPKEPATPPHVTYKEVGARAVPIMLAEPSVKIGSTNELKVGYAPPAGVSYS